MIECSSGNIKWLQFCHLSEIKKLRHGVFQRHGGISRGSLSSLNFGFSRGDEPSNVHENEKRTSDALALSFLFRAAQPHGDIILEAKRDLIASESSLIGDSFVTGEPGLGLMILHADCQAAIFYDPIRHILANVHSGWRGSTKNIYEKTICYLKQRYGCDPQNLLVGISPSLGPQAAEFRNYSTELPAHFWQFQVKPTYFDFWEISRHQLTQAGILESHIEIARICTYSNPQDWFSHRYDPNSGRNATIAALL